MSRVLHMHPELHPPLIRRWSTPANPLPVRTLRGAARSQPHTLDLATPACLATGPRDRPFDFSERVRQLCADIVARCDELHHVDVSRLLFVATQTRNGRTRGLQARVTPLRCREGRLTRQHGGATYQVQRYFVDGREMLYIITFYLPRFLNQDLEDKFVTLFHELYHISPAFNGDLRRDGGRCAIHSPGKYGYDLYMADLARAYLDRGADPALYAFLRLNFAQLEHRHGQVQAIMLPRPRLIPIADPLPDKVTR